ncbi:MAG: type II toxin-antitoxin system HicB family antitoxin [Tannerella sp.]|jgi:predicted RNase H-like HicB family nuclease|nr:type II toxin-antitoxin system HicB family antitoxin [Tannerella sp.]
MKTVVVTVEMTDHNYSAYAESLPGCVTTGKSMAEIKTGMKEAIEGHLEVSREFGDKIPEEFEGKYRLVFRFDAESLLTHYKGIFTNSALEKLTGINQRQLQRYASGKSHPMKPQSLKIQKALHRLGEELLDIEL